MKKLKVGLAGLGTVGAGVYEILQKDAKILSARTQTQIEIVAVASRSIKDFVDGKIKFYANPIDLANDPEIDVIVEVMGGISTSQELLRAALKNGKKFVTANKALLAERGGEIAELVEKYNGHIGFEASTAGANPVIKTFKESFTAGEITEFYAILNGTCNFILTKMGEENLGYEQTLQEAQKLGYAEADPTLDIKGIDAAHKLALLSAIAASAEPAFAHLSIEGVEEVTLEDVKLANELGYKIKLLAIYKNFGNACQQTVYPALIKKSEKIAQVDGPFNAMLLKHSNASFNFSIGRGAGALPTGSAIVADLVDIACGRTSKLFGVAASQLQQANVISVSQRVGKYFLRILLDKNLAQKGDLAANLFGEKIDVSQATFIDKGEEILCGFLTEKQKEQTIVEALKNLDASLVKSAKFLRVEETNF